MPKFKIGDRVRFKPKCGEFGSSLTFSSCFNPEFDDVMEHPYGTVRGFFEKRVMVEFAQIHTGHSCSGMVPSYNGLYIHPQELDHMSNTKVISISKLI